MQIVIQQIAIFLHGKTSLHKLRKTTIITVTNCKYNYNTTKSKFKNEPQNLKKLFTGERCI